MRRFQPAPPSTQPGPAVTADVAAGHGQSIAQGFLMPAAATVVSPPTRHPDGPELGNLRAASYAGGAVLMRSYSAVWSVSLVADCSWVCGGLSRGVTGGRG
jgi:hypothetical protein